MANDNYINEEAINASRTEEITTPVTGFRTLSVTLPDGNIVPYARFALRLLKPMPLQSMLVHCAMGLSGEAGEFSDAIKKHAIYGKALDRDNAIEEAGDIAFYLQAACNTLGVSLEEVIQANANKLAARYTSLSYSDSDAIARKDKTNEQA